MRRTISVRNLAAVAPFIIALLLGMQTSVSGQESDSAKVARLFSESSAKPTKATGSVWTLPFEGKSLKDIIVGVTVGEGLVVTYSRLLETKNVKFTPQALETILKLNFTFDRVKVGIDPEGILFVRTDVSVRTLDKEELLAGIEQVAAAVDETHKALRPHLPKAK